MSLHPEIQQALTAAVGLPSYADIPIAQARALAKLAHPANPTPVPVGAVRDMSIPGPGGPIPARLYQPKAPPGAALLPALVYFHGSGFVVLDLDSHDDICRRLCAGAACVVLSVDYRLAPEHKFPAAPDDCLAATRWLAAQADALGIDASRIALAGDSAGACLAAVTAQRIRDEGGPALCGQLLFYPVTDFPDTPAGSYIECGQGYGLTRERMLWFWEQYLAQPAQAVLPMASPMRAPSLAGLPAACVLTAQYDVLRDEGHAYARRLREAGVHTLERCFEGMNHGFLKYCGAIDQADSAMNEACAWLRLAFAGAGPRPLGECNAGADIRTQKGDRSCAEVAEKTSVLLTSLSRLLRNLCDFCVRLSALIAFSIRVGGLAR